MSRNPLASYNSISFNNRKSPYYNLVKQSSIKGGGGQRSSHRPLSTFSLPSGRSIGIWSPLSPPYFGRGRGSRKRKTRRSRRITGRGIPSSLIKTVGSKLIGAVALEAVKLGARLFKIAKKKAAKKGKAVVKSTLNKAGKNADALATRALNKAGSKVTTLANTAANKVDKIIPTVAKVSSPCKRKLPTNALIKIQ